MLLSHPLVFIIFTAPRMYVCMFMYVHIHTWGRGNNAHFRPADGKFANGSNERIQRYCKVA